MGLFDVFKKKRRETVLNELKQAEDFGAIAKVLSKNSLISKPKDGFHNSLGEDLRHLTADGELPFGWIAYHTDVVNQIESELSVFRSNINGARDSRQLRTALQSYMLYLEDGKKHYCQIGECEGKYFEEYIIDSEETRGNRERLGRLESEE